MVCAFTCGTIHIDSVWPLLEEAVTENNKLLEASSILINGNSMTFI